MRAKTRAASRARSIPYPVPYMTSLHLCCGTWILDIPAPRGHTRPLSMSISCTVTYYTHPTLTLSLLLVTFCLIRPSVRPSGSLFPSSNEVMSVPTGPESRSRVHILQIEAYDAADSPNIIVYSICRLAIRYDTIRYVTL